MSGYRIGIQIVLQAFSSEIDVYGIITLVKEEAEISKLLYLVAIAALTLPSGNAEAQINTPSSTSYSIRPKSRKSIFTLRTKDQKPLDGLARMFGKHHDISNTPESKREMGYFALVRSADDLLKAGNVAQAGTIYKKVIAENEGRMVTAGAIAGLAEIARRSGDNQSAVNLYRNLVYGEKGRNWASSYSNASDVRLNFALLLKSTGQLQEAWKHFQFAVNLDSGWFLPEPPTLVYDDVVTVQFDSVANLALANRFLHSDPARSIEFARAAVRINPTDGLSHYYLGRLLSKNREAEAKSEFKKAILYGHGDYVKQAQSYLQNGW